MREAVTMFLQSRTLLEGVPAIKSGNGSPDSHREGNRCDVSPTLSAVQ